MIVPGQSEGARHRVFITRRLRQDAPRSTAPFRVRMVLVDRANPHTRGILPRGVIVRILWIVLLDSVFNHT